MSLRATLRTMGAGDTKSYWCTIQLTGDNGMQVNLRGTDKEHAIAMVAVVNKESPRDEYGNVVEINIPF